MSEVLHATLVARWTGGRWRGALLRGASGAGKSTVALRCMTAGFRLIADDRVVAFASGGRVFGKPPRPLAGLLEVRSVGVLDVGEVPHPLCAIDLLVDLQPEAERYPDTAVETVAGLPLPRLALTPADADLPRRLTIALAALQRGL